MIGLENPSDEAKIEFFENQKASETIGGCKVSLQEL